MALDVRTVIVGEEWTLVTSSVSVIQFNDEMYMAVTEGIVPTSDVGFTYMEGDEYTNGANHLYVWVKKKPGGTNVESVRVLENIQ